MKILTYLSVAALGLCTLSAAAQAQKPVVEKPIPGKNVILSKVSNNGKWAVSESGSTTDGDIRPIGGMLFNMDNFKYVEITSPNGLAGVSDVTDDGNIVVGECDGMPAYWTKSTGKWTKLAFQQAGFDHGRLNAVTPDGKYAVGVLTSALDELAAYAVMFDLSTGKRVDLPGLPTLDQSHRDLNENALYDISPDGRYITGMLSQAYLLDTIDDKAYAPLCTYVYDVQTGTYDMIGFDDYADKDWGKKAPYLHFISGPRLSNNGEWVTGDAYMVEEIPGSKWPKEAYHAFRYNVKTKEFQLYGLDTEADIAGFAIDNNGVVYGAMPAQNPYPNCVVRSGDYFIPLRQIFEQVYDYDFEGDSGYTVTGKPLSISDDGRTLIMLPDTDGCYVLRLPDPLAEAAAKVKLLGSYSVAPAEGSQLSRLTSITLTFDRNVKVRGNANKITFQSADGKEKYNPVSAVADGKKVTITFRSRDLNDAAQYTLTVPEGLIRMDGNEDEMNEEIKLEYVGRANKPVQAMKIVPEDGAYVKTLDVTSNPIVILFDTDIKLAEGGHGELYRNDETTPYCLLNIGISGKQAVVFPTAGQNLYEGSEYHVVIPEGTLTDISDAGPNKEITFTYHGMYNRSLDINPSMKYVFSDDASDFAQMMCYEGDLNTPAEEVAGWGFTADTTPWWVARDDDDFNMAFTSHSMYTPAGKSDDWMVTLQMVIPDEKCYLEFLGQSYLKGAKDYLDVYIYPCDAVYNTLTKDVVEDIRAKGHHVMHELLSPGKSEGGLAGDWQTYTVPLAEYSGQAIYIAFVNNNEDQSAIFLDDIRVVHDTAYTISFDTPSRVVNQDKVEVSGFMVFESDQETYNSIKLTLSDAEGTEIDKIEEKGLNLTKGSQYEFKFTHPISVKLGETSPYYVEVSLDDATPAKVTGKVSNLTFQPNRRIVLEEYTGSECPNCPQGIRGIENIQMLYPNVLIPITIRTYQSDALGLGMGAYSSEIGLDALGAPSAIIDRKEAGYPMLKVEDDYRFSGAGVTNTSGTGDERCWLDIFRTEYETPAEVGLTFTSTLDADKKNAKVELYLANALNRYRAAYKVFAVITEDGLRTYQKSNVYTSTDPDFGEWGAGGKYGSDLLFDVEAHGVARQTWGTTFTGTAGLFPAQMKAGQGYTAEFTVSVPESIQDTDNCNMVVMIIDENNQVLNANISKLNGSSATDAVDSVLDENESAVTGMTVYDGKLYINASGEYTVAAYDQAGARILSAKAAGEAALPLNGYKGILIVKATDNAGNARTAKFIVR